MLRKNSVALSLMVERVSSIALLSILSIMEVTYRIRKGRSGNDLVMIQ